LIDRIEKYRSFKNLYLSEMKRANYHEINKNDIKTLDIVFSIISISKRIKVLIIVKYKTFLLSESITSSDVKRETRSIRNDSQIVTLSKKK